MEWNIVKLPEGDTASVRGVKRREGAHALITVLLWMELSSFSSVSARRTRQVSHAWHICPSRGDGISNTLTPILASSRPTRIKSLRRQVTGCYGGAGLTELGLVTGEDTEMAEMAESVI